MTGQLAGLGTLLRTFARRDRWLVLWFTVGVTVLYWSQAVSVDGLYKTQAEFDKAAASMQDNAAFIAMTGPARALNTTGGQVTWQSTAFGAILVGLMAMFLIGRHTRAEEESGRDELLRSGVVGRQAPMTAALLLTAAASGLVGACVTASLIAYGLATAGALALGLGLWLCGLVFGAVALLAAQLTSSTRTMYGMAGAAIGVAYGLRAIGDVGNGALSWLSPIGWYQAMHAYSGERWWPALLLVAATMVAAGAAYAVFARRDVGSGVWPARPGPARAPVGLQGSLGLAWRLQRGSLIAWAAGLFVGGLAYGSIGDDVTSLLGDSDFAQDVFGANGPDLVDSFYATSALMLALIGAGFAISSTLRPRSEENDGQVESLLATALPRWRWLASHLVITLAGTVAVVALSGLGLGLGFALATGDASKIGPFTWATTSLLPAVLLLAGLALLLYGALPRAASLAWLALLVCVVVMMFGEALQLPDWLRDLSPFEHLALVPAVSVDWAAALGVLGIAAVMAAAGQVAFLRRDLR
jgi:ABC-2 type transport system permease protein